MDASLRRARLTDLPALTDLLLRDARQRSALEPSVWRVADDARARVEGAVVASLDGSNARLRELWHVAEVAGKLVGVTHAMVVTRRRSMRSQSRPGYSFKTVSPPRMRRPAPLRRY